MIISVIGLGYVGLSNALIYARKYKVIGFDIDKQKTELLKKNISYIQENDLKKELKKTKNLNIVSKLSDIDLNSDFIIIAIPVNYIKKNKSFDTSPITNLLHKLTKYELKSLIVIKSTVPIGYCDSLKSKFPKLDIIFSPEFLREGMSIFDSLNPQRLIFGGKSRKIQKFITATKSILEVKNPKIIITSNSEAEAIKLFSNAYLAMRVSFFNEVDSFSLKNNLNSKNIINGISSDSRIGNYYNNPSFGYGGYCLPKDTNQIASSFFEVPNPLIKSITLSNQKRIDYIVEYIKSLKIKKLGFYKLQMKKNSDNLRNSVPLEILKRFLNDKNFTVKLYDSGLKDIKLSQKETDFDKFIQSSDLIIANRIDKKISPYKLKLFTRDIYERD